MKKTFFFSLLLLLGGCRDQAREQRLQQKEAKLAHREQELLLHEHTLALREQRLTKAAQALDSTRQLLPIDSVQASVLGSWATRMECTDTDCPGSAIGDSKNEQWQISTVQNTLLVKASVNNKVVRVYRGSFNGNMLEMKAQSPVNDTLPDAIITVQLQRVNSRRLEGRREIQRSDNCRTVYALVLSREATLPASLTPLP